MRTDSFDNFVDLSTHLDVDLYALGYPPSDQLGLYIGNTAGNLVVFTAGDPLTSKTLPVAANVTYRGRVKKVSSSSTCSGIWLLVRGR
jgi:hypothetical protein